MHAKNMTAKNRMDRSLSRFLCATCLLASVVAMSVVPSEVRAETYRDSEDAHPLKVAYLFVYPVGKFLELTVTRPLAAAGEYVAPYRSIDDRQSRLCSRERSARGCTSVAR